MTAIVPSFIAKVSRAKKHIEDLETAVANYVASHPYTVITRIESQGKHRRKVRRLEFTVDPANTDIPILAADAIYNLRSSLDHLQCCMVPKSRGGSAFFPIYFEGVWEPGIPGDDEQRLRHRGRWATDIKGLPDGAIAILKSLQPADGTLPDGEVNLLKMINGMSNTDRHTKIPVVASGLASIVVRWKMADGSAVTGQGIPAQHRFLVNYAELGNIPDEAMDMEIDGAPVIVAPTGGDGGHVTVPKDLIAAAQLIEHRIIPSLTPFIRR